MECTTGTALAVWKRPDIGPHNLKAKWAFQTNAGFTICRTAPCLDPTTRFNLPSARNGRSQVNIPTSWAFLRFPGFAPGQPLRRFGLRQLCLSSRRLRTSEDWLRHRGSLCAVPMCPAQAVEGLPRKHGVIANCAEPGHRFVLNRFDYVILASLFCLASALSLSISSAINNPAQCSLISDHS